VEIKDVYQVQQPTAGTSRVRRGGNEGLDHKDELMVKDIARLGRLTQSQARRALEELVVSGEVLVRKLQRPRNTLYHMRRLS
jgi:Fic family protein